MLSISFANGEAKITPMELAKGHTGKKVAMQLSACPTTHSFAHTYMEGVGLEVAVIQSVPDTNSPLEMIPVLTMERQIHLECSTRHESRQ